jgi:hypothetical protein
MAAPAAAVAIGMAGAAIGCARERGEAAAPG